MIQDLINAATPGSTVTVPPGSYDVDVNNPITFKSDITLDLTGVTLNAIPNANSFQIMLSVTGLIQNVSIINGTIIGERDKHLDTTDVGGGGGCIAIGLGTSNVKVTGTKISNSFADGILVRDATATTITNVICDNNRRQGLSATNVNGLYVLNSQFTNSGGTPPGDGIDLENDFDTETITNVTISGCTFAGNQGSGVGVGSPGQYSNITITGCSFDGKTQPIWTAGNAGSLGTPWWAALLHLIFRQWWGYPTSWSK